MISFSPVWVKLVSVSPTTSGFYRVLFGGVALTLFLIFTRQRLHLSKRVWLVLLLSSVFFALDLWFWHRSVNYVGPGLSTLLANFQVFFMMLAGVLMLGQRPRPIQIVAVPLALVGLGMIVGFDWQSLPADYRLGVVFALPTREVAIISIGSAVILGLSATVEGVSLAIPTLSDATWLLLLIASSLPKVSTTEAGLALLLQPTLSFVWDVVFFARPMTAMEIAGAAIALGAIYLGSRPGRV